MQRHLLIGLGLIAATLTVYWQVWDHEFVLIDHPDHFLQNPRVLAGLSLENVQWAFLHGHGWWWHPLAWVSLMLDVQLFGNSPAGFHAMSLLYHVINVLLVYAALTRLTGRAEISALTALMFAVHPLQVEAVAWVSSRKILVSAMFGLGTLYLYAGYAKRPSAWRLISTLLMYLLCLFSGVTLVALPLVMLLLDYWPLCRWDPSIRRQLILEKIPFFVLGVVVTAYTLTISPVGDWYIPVDSLSLGDRMAQAVVTFTTYICALFWPVHLCVYYPVEPDTYLPSRVIESMIFLLVITGFFVRESRAQPFLLVGWLWYLLMISPMLGVFSTSHRFIADGYTYFPFIGLYVIILWAVADLYANATPSRRLALGLGLGMSYVILLTISQFQLTTWRTSEALFGRALAVTKNNSFAHHYLGRALLRSGDVKGAVEQLQLARKIRPRDVDVLNDLALGLMRAGNLAEANQHLSTALDLEPNLATTYLNLGRIEQAQGDFAGALDRYKSALRLSPGLVDAQLEMAISLTSLGRFDEAASACRRALEFGESSEAHGTLGQILLYKQDFDGAVAELEQALALAPNSPGYLSDLADALSLRGETQAAKVNYEAALKLDPQLIAANRGLAILLASQGKLDEALRYFQAVQRLNPRDLQATQVFIQVRLKYIDRAIARYSELVAANPKDADAHGKLAYSLAMRRRHREAIEHFHAALELRPGWLDAANNLAWMLATLNDGDLRNGNEAVKWATLVCEQTGHGNVEYLDTLAAAYAEQGDFTQAVRIAETAIQIARANENERLAESIETRAKLYRSRRPYREPIPEERL
ncbi:MAG: tetratricopeptide repeat protein [Planctomycetota bacterium]